MASLSEKTLVPLGVAVAVIGGGAAWLSVLYARVEANTGDLAKLSAKQEIYAEALNDIKSDLRLIKSSLDRMEKKR